MPSLDYIAQRLARQKAKSPDLQAALADAVNEAVAKVLADHQPPQPAALPASVINRLRAPTPSPQRPAASLSVSAATAPERPAPPTFNWPPGEKPVVVHTDALGRPHVVKIGGADIYLTRDGDGRILTLTSPIGTSRVTQRDETGRLVSFTTTVKGHATEKGQPK